MKKWLFVVLLCMFSVSSMAQERGLTGRFYGVLGHSYAENFYGSMAMVADYSTGKGLGLTGGVELFRGSGYAATAAWQSRLPWPSEHFFLYNRYLYRLFARWNLNEFSSHVALGYETKHWRFTFGVANRFMSPFHAYDKSGSTDYVFEPFNIMYEIYYKTAFGRDDSWTFGARASDYDDFVTDRTFQPMFSVAVGHDFTKNVDIYLRTVCCPTGMFSLSANYYELFFILGLHKKW
ncbi:MAG: hypothetical protein J6W88_02580 [Bacteroidales bacterium]|nr:hypothetical protein [Bacteroidales bacterium]